MNFADAIEVEAAEPDTASVSATGAFGAQDLTAPAAPAPAPAKRAFKKATREELLAFGLVNAAMKLPAADPTATQAPSAPPLPPAAPAQIAIPEGMTGAKRPGRKPTSQPPLGESPANNWHAMPWPDPCTLLVFVYPHIQPFKWQAEELMRLAGHLNIQNGDRTLSRPTDKEPLIYNLAAVNGSGKDAIVVTTFAAWFATSKIRSRCIITSASHNQLKSQTFKFLYDFCETYNQKAGEKVFEITEFRITCVRTGSEIRGFVTDDPGKAEGFHPFNDYPGAEMAIIVNEAKSIKDELFIAFLRFTGYSHWIEVSSPGIQAGHFYRKTTSAPLSYPKPARLGMTYARRVTAFDCPNITASQINQVKLLAGEHSILYRSSILCQFVELAEGSFISSDLFLYDAPAWSTYDLPRKAGVDLGLGGDESVFLVVHGNKVIALETTRTKDAGRLKVWVIDMMRKYGVAATDVSVDDGGIGKPIVQDIRAAGYDVRRVNNEAAPLNKREFKMRGAENWGRVKRLLELKILILPQDDTLRLQLANRGFSVEGIRVALEPKKDMKKRGLPSPDRADALALAFSQTTIEHFVNFSIAGRIAQNTLADELKAGIVSPQDIEKLKANYDAYRFARAARERADKEPQNFTIYGNQSTRL